MPEPQTEAAKLEDASRRTVLAAERTWLAWWRSGIAASATAVAVGGVVPSLVSGSHAAYVVLGVGYALLAVAMFVGSAVRQRSVDAALERGEHVRVDLKWVAWLTIAAGVLSIATMILLITEL